MIVFKNYFKIFKKQILMIVLYMSIFSILTILLTQNKTVEYKPININLGIVDNAKNEESNKLKLYLKEYAKVSEYEKEDRSLDLNIYYRTLDYAVVIPKDFNLDSELKSITIESSYASLYVSNIINNYFNLYKQYKESGVENSKILDLVINTSKEKAKVNMLKKESNIIDSARYFFNSLNYVLLAMIISVVGLVMFSFKKKEIRNRNISSSYGIKNINKEVFLGNILGGTLLWFATMIIFFISFGKTMFNPLMLLMELNSYIFMIMVVSLSILISSLVNKKDSLNGITNVVALGSSFLAGAFVPQEFLGKGVVSFSKILPSYWYIDANNKIVNNQSILLNIFILIGFTLLFYVINLYITKKQTK